MENAAEALRMAFVVLVFVIAMSLAFMMITQARSTADVVFQTTDKQEYVTGITSIGQDRSDEYRIVGIDTVVPTIYRYAQENYGVTIIDGSDIVALYDLQVENTISSISTTWNGTNKTKFEKLCKGVPNGSTDDVVGIATYIENATGNVTFKNWGTGDGQQFQELFETIYSITNPGSTSCPWTSSTYNIMKRIKADMTGSNSTYFGENDKMQYKNEKLPTGFINQYGDAKFKEYYYTVKTKNNLTEEEETSKLQIIYVKE